MLVIIIHNPKKTYLSPSFVSLRQSLQFPWRYSKALLNKLNEEYYV